MLQEKDSHERPIRFLPVLQHAVQAPPIIEPTERPFHFPALTTISFVMTIFRGTTTGNRDMILAIGREGNNPALSQGAAVRLAIVPFIQAQAFGVAFAFADANTIDRLQQFDEIIAVGSTEREVEGMPMRVDHEVAFEPVNPVFS